MAQATEAKASDIAQLFTMLLGRSVRVRKGGLLQTGTRDHFTMAFYKDETGTVVGAFGLDIQSSCAVGAALSLFPPAVVKQSVDSGEIEATLMENLREVYNIASRFFNDIWDRPVSLADVSVDRTGTPREARLFLTTSRRQDFQINIDKYGVGNMAMFYPKL